MQPDFEQLLQIIRLLAQKAELDFVRVVLASKDGDVAFVEVTDGVDFRVELQEAIGGGMLAIQSTNDFYATFAEIPRIPRAKFHS